MMNVHLTTTGIEGKHRENRETVKVFEQILQRYANGKYQTTPNGDQADIILFLEPNNYRRLDYRKTLLCEPLVRRYPERCFAYDYSDCPAGYLPGVYVGIPKRQCTPNKYKSGGYLTTPYNDTVALLAEQRAKRPSLLASFRGSASHPVRNKIFKVLSSPEDIAITETFAWFSHSEDDKRAYSVEMSESHFVLCPRGVAPTSIRLFETMQMGRVPVIISDDWMPPDGPDWESFSVRVAEKDIRTIPRILLARKLQAVEMGEVARIAWEQYFAPNVQIGRIAEYAEAIMKTRGAEYDGQAEIRYWTSFKSTLDQSFATATQLLSAVPRKVHHVRHRR